MSMDPFTNDYHDIAQSEAFDLGFDALHVRAPDEVLMEAEEYVGNDDADERVRCVISVLRAVTWKAASLKDIQDKVALLMLCKVDPNAVPVRELWHGRVNLTWARDRYAKLVEERRIDWHAETGEMLLRRFVCRGWAVEEVAKMVLLTLYAALPDQRFRPQMAASLGEIGKALGLRAANKRSAMSASMKSNVTPLFQAVAIKAGGKPRKMKLWFMKNEHCREALSVAMRGKRNRAGKAQKAESGVRSAESLRQGLPETGRHDQA